MNKNYNIINKKILYKGFFKLFQYTFKHIKHDGSWSEVLNREIFGGAQVAAVLPYDKKKQKIILIDQFRSGLIEQNENTIIKEIVAGYIDKGEKPEEAAIRECKEETGCSVKKLKKIYSYYPAPGSSHSFYHLFLAEVEAFNGERILGKKDENEDILVKSYGIDEVRKILNNKKIINGVTIIALQWFFANYKNI